MTGTGNGTRDIAPGAPQRRFYKAASIADVGDGLAQILLDGRPVRTPARGFLVAPWAVAERIASEWDAQETHIRPLTMPVTRLVNTAIDGVANAMDPVGDEIVSIAANDMLFYRADSPAGLVARQAEIWDPLLADAQATLGVPMTVTAGIMPVEQDERYGPAVRRLLPAEPLPLAALHQLSTLTGSPLIALALMQGRIPFSAGWSAAHVDEDWNVKEWGEDEEAVRRRAQRERDAEAAHFVLTAPRPALR